MVTRSSNLKPPIEIGEIIEVTVENIKSIGIDVFIKDTSFKGFINRREISWSRKINDAREFGVKKDQILKAKIVSITNNELELSIKRLKEEPYLIYEKILQEGDIVIGHVFNIYKYGANIEITGYFKGNNFFQVFEEGLSAHVSISQILDQKLEHTEEALLPGDKIKAIIESKNLNERRFELSIRRLLIIDQTQYLPKDTILNMTTILKLKKIVDSEKNVLERHKLSPKANSLIRKILLIDDSLEYCRNFYDLLKEEFERIDYVTKELNLTNAESTGLRGIEQFQKESYNLVIIDLLLDSVDGLMVAKSIKQLSPDVYIIFITGGSISDDQKKLLNEMKLNNVLSKMLPTLKLVNYINNIVEDELNGTEIEISDKNQNNVPITLKDIERSSLKDKDTLSLEKLLEQAETETGSHFSIILKMNTILRDAEFLVKRGVAESNYNNIKYEIKFSPLLGVFTKQDIICENDIYKDNEKYKHIFPISETSFTQVLGYPLFTEDGFSYGIFLFKTTANNEKKEEDAYTKNDIDKIRGLVDEMVHIIKLKRLEEIIKENQKLFIQGSNFSSFLHELTNVLKPHLIAIENINKIINDNQDNLKLMEYVKSLLGLPDKINNIKEIFLNLNRKKNIEYKDIYYHLQHFCKYIESILSEKNIYIELSVIKEIPKITINTSFLDQVILNILVNAVDFIPKIRYSGGRVEISIDYEEKDNLPLKIKISDNGPGIHRAYQEKIFTMFFTTKEKGSGLGLYIVNDLIKKMKGRVCVEDSIMYFGTNFLIELPKNILEV